MPTIDNWRTALMRAAINCQHTITSESVSLAQSDEQSERNALAQLADRLGEAVKPLLDERDRLAAEVEALRADAGRYRWLRNESDPDADEPFVTIHKMNSWGKWFNTVEQGDELDEAVDAAMKGKP